MSEEKKASTILSYEEISDLKRYYPDAVKEALRQVEMLAQDNEDTRKSYDKKAMTLLGIYISFSTILVSLSQLSEILNWPMIFGLLGSGFVFIVGAICLLLSLKGRSYGTIGRMPSTWLYDKCIFEDESGRNHAIILARILHDYQKKLDGSFQSNLKKGRWITRAVWSGVIAPIVLIVGAIWTTVSALMNYSFCIN